MLFLSARSANKTPHALCSAHSWRQQAAVEEMQFAPLRRCLGKQEGTLHFPAFLVASYTALKKNKGSQIIHYTGNMTKRGPFCGAVAALVGEL